MTGANQPDRLNRSDQSDRQGSAARLGATAPRRHVDLAQALAVRPLAFAWLVLAARCDRVIRLRDGTVEGETLRAEVAQ